MNSKIIRIVLFLFLIADLVYSFEQHRSQPLDGDMASIIIPVDKVTPVLDNPFATGVLLKGQSYENPNRFFCHYSMKKYFENAPLFLQQFTSPVNSLYLSCAILKIMIQVFLILLLAGITTGTFKITNLNFLLAAVCITPFFQTEGYQSYMGIIDRSVTYTFFYALPFAILLLYFLPFILQYYHGKKLRHPLPLRIFWIFLAPVICLSGPINPGIILVFSFLVFIHIFLQNYRRSEKIALVTRIRDSITGVPGNYWFCLVPACLFSIYSLLIGMHNAANVTIPLAELYSRIPAGILNPLTRKLGFPLLLLAIAINCFLVTKYPDDLKGAKLLITFRWIGIFILLYILLLPLGGYREYRHNIIRYDTLIPVTICLVLLFCSSTICLINAKTTYRKVWYFLLITGILLFFTINDEQHFDKNNSERAALQKLSASDENIVKLPHNCLVLSWGRIVKPEDSELQARLLVLWKVTKRKQYFYNE